MDLRVMQGQHPNDSGDTVPDRRAATGTRLCAHTRKRRHRLEEIAHQPHRHRQRTTMRIERTHARIGTHSRAGLATFWRHLRR
jgi:hypothetical protein